MASNYFKHLVYCTFKMVFLKNFFTIYLILKCTVLKRKDLILYLFVQHVSISTRRERKVPIGGEYDLSLFVIFFS